jgi:SAM-dependent methyltransferase
MNSSTKLTRDFNPGLFHPEYLIRKGLLKAMKEFSRELNGKLMDFGCGSKPYRSLIDVEEYIGVDFKNEGHPHDNEQIDVYYDGKSLPFDNEQFDSVLCSEVFEHIFNLDEVLKEINRVMKKGGKILITCPFVWNEHEVPHDYARYTRFALDDILKRNNFEIIRYEKTGNFITTIGQLRVLYFRVILQEKCRKIFFLRWGYKFFFVLLPNLAAIFFNAILPENDSVYMNNVVLARKVK